MTTVRNRFVYNSYVGHLAFLKKKKTELKELRHLVTMASWTDTHEILDSIQTIEFMLRNYGTRVS